jgi:hypothetical protein
MNNRPVRANAEKDITTMMQEELCASDTTNGRQKWTGVAYFVLVDRHLRGIANINMDKMSARVAYNVKKFHIGILLAVKYH